MNALKARSEANKNRMSPSQERAMMKEIKRQCAAYYRKHEMEVMALFLWYLREKKGHSYNYLKDFFFDFTPLLNEMLDRYELQESDTAWLCSHKLKEELGIDLEEWEREYESSTKKQKT